MTDYLQVYWLEEYLFQQVGPHFRATSKIEPVDFFAILIWKSNRSKTKIRNGLKKRGNCTFGEAVAQIARSLFDAEDDRRRLAILMNTWGLRLPMASAILTVLYPDYFTVYDTRVSRIVDMRCIESPFSDKCWNEYQQYKKRVFESAPPNLSLRDKDRFLWARSFWNDAIKEVNQ